MDNVTVSVNKKSLSRGYTVFIEKPWVVLPSVMLRVLPYRKCFQYTIYIKSRRAAVLQAKEKL